MNATKHALRPDLPPLPERIRLLPVDERGYPVPWFVSWIEKTDDHGQTTLVPEFRAADGQKLVRAVRDKLCWVCGGPLGRYASFVLGPMCAVNRNSAEPPCHKECAIFSCMACPFLSKPQMDRRENNLPEDLTEPAGIFLRRNPGCVAVWTCKDWNVLRYREGILFNPGEPTGVLWFALGHVATRAQVQAAVDAGLPTLQAEAEKGGPEDVAALAKMILRAQDYYPRE